MSLLQKIKSDDFILSLGYEMPPKAMRYVLLRTEECKQLRDAYWSGNLSDVELHRYIQNLMGKFVSGEKFSYDMTLSLLAVALEPLYTSFADEYLTTLANLELSEMPLSIRVAKLCVQTRQQGTNNVYRKFSVSRVEQFNVYHPWETFKARERAIKDYHHKVEAA